MRLIKHSKWNGPLNDHEPLNRFYQFSKPICQIPDILLMNSHDQEPITCHDFAHAAHNSLSVTGKRPSRLSFQPWVSRCARDSRHLEGGDLSVTGNQELPKFFCFLSFISSLRNLFFLSRGKGEGRGWLRVYRPPVKSSGFLVSFINCLISLTARVIIISYFIHNSRIWLQSPLLITHHRDQDLVSVIERVRNSGSFFQ